MEIPCYRCEKPIESPSVINADYIIAEDTIVRELVEVFVALKHNAATLAKQERIKEVDPDTSELKHPNMTISVDEYDQIEVQTVEEAEGISGIVKVIGKVIDKDIQKTGIICPNCYATTDFVIWGVHKS